MGLLTGKRILITDFLSNRLIVYGITDVCKREGVGLVSTYVGECLKDRITELTTKFDSKLVFDCDVSSDEQIVEVFEDLGQYWDHLDGLVYSTNFAPREVIADNFTDGPSRESLRITHDISAYSFPVLAKATLPVLSPTASLLVLTYLGAERIVPNYNTMGLAKMSLEVGVRCLAGALRPKGIRANGISAGLIKTLAASGIRDFGKLLKHMEDVAPLRRSVMIEEAGSVTAFLLSDLASGVTSEVAYVDCGFNVTVGVLKGVGQG